LTSALRSRPRIDAELADKPGEPIGAQPNVQPILCDLDPLDQELDDARLLGREELVPERVELQERVPDLPQPLERFRINSARSRSW